MCERATWICLVGLFFIYLFFFVSSCLFDHLPTVSMSVSVEAVWSQAR